MPKKRRALILYATMTRNTEKIATWFKETFEFYNWDVTMFKMAFNADWAGMQEKLYFDDYDVVCLGSPIVGGSPLQIVVKAMSLGAGGGPGGLDHSADAPPPSPKAAKPGESPPDAKMGGPKMLAMWRRGGIPYMGVMREDNSQPIGIVFTTYGGGFYGSKECFATLETLKMYLELNDCLVIGTFACCGKESGPAGLSPGEIPKPFDPDMTEEYRQKTFRTPEVYVDADGGEHYGSFFHHTHMEQRPGPREEAKAKALIADIVEDHFFSHNDERKRVGSPYISIS